MQNRSLIKDHLTRARNRLAAIEVLYQREGWADVVRESQEVVELSLKALLRASNIEVPRVHDVSNLLLEHQSQFSKGEQSKLEKLAKISKSLRRDRELAFYGSEDLTPSEFYKKEDADEAKKNALFVTDTVSSLLEADKTY